MPCHATHTLDCTAGIDEADLSFEAGESIVVTTTTTPEAAGEKKTHHLLRRLIATKNDHFSKTGSGQT